MPNICMNDVTFYSESQKDLSDFYCFLDKGTDGDEPGRFVYLLEALNICPSGVSHRGNVTWGLGMRVKDCIGICHTANKGGDFYYFSLETETAWNSDTDFWAVVTGIYNARFGTSIKFVNISEECGVGLYEKTDKNNLFYPQKYRVFVECEGEEYFMEPQSVNTDLDLSFVLCCYISQTGLPISSQLTENFKWIQRRINNYFEMNNINGQCYIDKYVVRSIPEVKIDTVPETELKDSDEELDNMFNDWVLKEG